MCCLRVQAEEVAQRGSGAGSGYVGGSMAQEAVAWRTVVLNGKKTAQIK